MNSRQREIVQSTWEYVLPMSEVAVEFFYSRLFFLDPSLRTFVDDDMRVQKRRLMPGFTLLVQGLDDDGALSPETRRLGRSSVLDHVKYAAPRTVRGALLHMLGEMLGPLFTAETEHAWIAAYDVFIPALFDVEYARA